MVGLTAVIVLGWFMLLPNPLAQLGLQSFAGGLFFPNILFLNQSGCFDQVPETKPLLHLWSLGVEEQFHLVAMVATVLSSPTQGAIGHSGSPFGCLSSL